MTLEDTPQPDNIESVASDESKAHADADVEVRSDINSDADVSDVSDVEVSSSLDHVSSAANPSLDMPGSPAGNAVGAGEEDAGKMDAYDSTALGYSQEPTQFLCVTCGLDLVEVLEDDCPQCGTAVDLSLSQLARTDFADAKPLPPKAWPTALIGILIVPVAVLVAGIFIGVAAAVMGGEEVLKDQAALQAWMIDYSKTPVGFLLVALPGQLTFLVAAWFCAKNAPEPIRERLGLTRSRMPGWTWLFFMLSMPALSLISYLIFPFLREDPGEALKEMSKMITEPTGMHAVMVVGFVSLAPGLCEELFFRGFVQQRLQKNWGPVLGIAFASVVFAAAHVDPKHAVAVLPIGIWLGVIAWRSGCIWPAILCHVFNNFYSSMAARFGLSDAGTLEGEPAASASQGAPVEETAQVLSGMSVVSLLMFIVPIFALCFSIGLLTPRRWWGRVADDEIELERYVAPHGRMWLIMSAVGVVLFLAASFAMSLIVDV